MTTQLGEWVRIDKRHIRVQPAEAGAVVRAAQGFSADAAAAIASGRFETPAAVYCRRDQLRADEPQPSWRAIG